MTTKKPWGEYTILRETDTYKVKEIVVNPGGKLSLQYHNRRREIWTVISGTGYMTLGDDFIELSPNSVVEIPLGVTHRIWNESDTDLTFVEVQTGDYFGEDDIVRLEDIYNRK